MRKKPFSLDYTIERDIDRLKAVEEILDKLPTPPNSSDLELMASYIMYGKDENGKNSIQRHETIEQKKRFNSFKKMDDCHESLDAIMDNPLADQTALHSVESRYVYTKKLPIIKRPKNGDPGDSDIPGMTELWAAIDRVDHTIAVAEGKLPPDEDTQLITDPYHLYQLRHQLIDMRRHQYYLKDAYKPTIHFLNLQPPAPQTINFDSDSAYWIPLEEWRQKTTDSYMPNLPRNLEDYETRTNAEGKTEVRWVVRHQVFDWENPNHVKCLIDHYSSIYMEVWDKLDSWGRTLIYDFDRYATMANLSPIREYVLLRRIDRATYQTIAEELREKFDVKYNENHLCSMITTEISGAIARCARGHRLQLETPEDQKKRCWTCKRLFPRSLLFFGLNSCRGDGFASNCKECERKRRIRRGEQSEHDNRTKDEKMRQM